MKYIYMLLLVVIFSLGTACNKPPTTLKIYAASSLMNVLNELTENYENNSPHTILISFAGSSTLRQQIEYGANPDIFISADQIQFQKAQGLNLLDKGSCLSKIVTGIPFFIN